MAAINSSVLALDVGSKRVGLAVASLDAKFPHPHSTLLQGEQFFDDLKKIIDDEGISELVIGLPRGLDGQNTQQTVEIATFTKELKRHFSLPIHFQDEAVTSKLAETELRARGKSYAKADIDALAATYILEDWFADRKDKI